MSAPLLGQPVRYWSTPGAPERAATVAHVNADGTVNLTVQEADGVTRSENRVAIGDTASANGHCEARAP